MVKQWIVTVSDPNFPATASPQVEIPFEPDSVSIALLGSTLGYKIEAAFDARQDVDATLIYGEVTQGLAFATNSRKIYLRSPDSHSIQVQVNASKAR